MRSVALRVRPVSRYYVAYLQIEEVMAKSANKTVAKSDAPKIVNICRNRRATHEYEILDKIECGIVLVGTEVKSLRDAHANLEDAYAKIENGEVFLVGCEIQEYTFGNRLNHKPKRDRKLLLHKKEIERFAGKASERGHTLIPLQMYFKNGVAKLELAVARGKQLHDKRETLKKAEAKREIDRMISSKRKTGR
jgi:SsrA-binding protein